MALQWRFWRAADSRPQQDLEMGVSYTLMRGFPAVAAYLARHEVHETYVIRKFNTLMAKKLIHLHGELAHLEHQIQEPDRKVEVSADLELKLSLRDWEELKITSEQRARDELQLKQLVQQIDVKLDRYLEDYALLQAASITQFKKPSTRVLDMFKDEFGNMGVSGFSAKMLDDAKDLVALRPPPDIDSPSNIVRNHGPFPAKRLSSFHYDGAEYFQERMLQIVASSESLVIAAVLLVGSITTLYFVHHPDTRLGLLIMFIILFATSIRMCTSLSRDGLLAATAAYAAVLVVFVFGDLANANKMGAG